MAESEQSADGGATWGARLLKPFAEVRPCEVSTVLALAATIFFTLTAYYLLKVIREPLILVSHGAEVKSYAAAVQAVLLIPVLFVHGKLARRVGRLTLIASVFLFCVSNLLVFALLYRSGVSIGLPFYIWVGTFNFLLVATFWSFANDVYSPEQGKRLFPIVGVGPTVGALAGAGLATWMLAHFDPMVLMLASGGLLVVCVGLFAWVHRHPECPAKDRGAIVSRSEPLRGQGGVEALLKDRYLLLVACIALLVNWVTNSGEYVLDSTLKAASLAAGLHGAEAIKYIGQFKGSYFLWINFLALFSQLFIVSRILKYLGVGTAMLMLPLVAMASAASMALFPVLYVIRTAKIVEKATDYSVQNTAQNALYLVVSRDAKYKTKAVIDSFVVRAGDVCAAAAIYLGTELLGVSVRGFAALNVLLTMIWLAVAWRVGSIYRARSGTEALAAAPPRQAVSSA